MIRILHFNLYIKSLPPGNLYSLKYFNHFSNIIIFRIEIQFVCYEYTGGPNIIQEFINN